MPVARAPGLRPGVALPTAVFALVAISVVAVGAYAMVDLNRMSAENRQDAARAVQLAEAGATHATALLAGDLAGIGFDQLITDSLLTGYDEIGEGDDIPASGVALTGGSYFVTLYDDPAETDGDPDDDTNKRILVRCRGVTSDGAEATVDLVVYAKALPAIAANGELYLSGSADILGECGSAHANDDLDIQGDGMTVEQAITAADSITGDGEADDPSNNPISPVAGADSVTIPTYTSAELCAETDNIDYTLNADGTMTTLLTGVTAAPVGWTQTNGVWSPGTTAPSGVYCVTGNVSISGNVTFRGAIIASGSIDLSGNADAYAEDITGTPYHPLGFLFVADGDIEMSGNSNSTTSGVIYAGAQCGLTGNGGITGQIMCNDGSQPADATDLTSTNYVTGSGQITYDCGGAIEGDRTIASWYQVIE